MTHGNGNYNSLAGDADGDGVDETARGLVVSDNDGISSHVIGHGYGDVTYPVDYNFDCLGSEAPETYEGLFHGRDSYDVVIGETSPKVIGLGDNGCGTVVQSLVIDCGLHPSLLND